MGQECRECDCPQGDLPHTQGIDEADPPGHACPTIKGFEWSQPGDVEFLHEETPPGLSESGDVHNVNGDQCHQDEVNVNVDHCCIPPK